MAKRPESTRKAVPHVWAAFFLLLLTAQNSWGVELVNLWRYPAAGRITGICGSSRRKVVYFLCEDRNLYAVTHSGVPLWKSMLGGKPTEYITEGPDGTLYVVLQNYSLLAINPRGKVLWETEALGEPQRVPQIDRGGIIYYFSVNGSITALSHTGAVRWQLSSGSSPAATALHMERGIFLWNPDKGAIELMTPWGSKRWEYLIEGVPGGMFTIGNIVAVIFDRLHTSTGIYTSGATAWTITDAAQTGRFRDGYRFGDRVFLLDSRGEVLELTKEGGLMPIGTLPADARGIAGVETGGYICGMGDRARFYLLDSNGTVHRFSLPRAGGSLPTRVSENMYVYGGEDWILYAFSIAGDEKQVYDDRPTYSGSEEEITDLQGLGGFQYHYLNYLLETEEVEDKREALRIISSYLAADEKGNRYYLSLTFLQRLLSQGVLDTEYGMGRIRNNFPGVRMEAAALLSVYGDLETSDALIRVLRYEYDPYAMAAEIEAIGRLKSDPDGRAGEIIKRIIQNDSISSGTNILADAALRAITSISNYHGTIDEHSIDTLFLIFKGNYSKDIRSRALAALQGVGK